MDIRTIVVREYLESLTEKDELNRIFPILLEAMGYTILSEPKQYTGIQEYGKDIVAIGLDKNIKKRFYFELKGGQDRHITETNFYGKDGIQDSITQAAYNKFISAFPEFDSLPLEIIIVHNGSVKGTVQSTMEAFLKQTQKNLKKTSFDRWDISRLTGLFTEHLFGPYLLTDSKTTKLFNRVLINLNASETITSDYIDLLDSILARQTYRHGKKLTRAQRLQFESIKLIAFIIQTEAKEYNNLEVSRKHLNCLLLKFWHWILKNKAENDPAILQYFDQVLGFFYNNLSEYLKRTLPIAGLQDGLYSERGGRYEQIGYTNRSFAYLQTFALMLSLENNYNPGSEDKEKHSLLVQLINENSVCTRPLLDIHSNTIVHILNLFIRYKKIDNARNYLKLLLQNIRYAKEKYDFIPDANNSIESVIKFIATGDKPVYYSDNTSPLIAALMEFTAILDMEVEYYEMQAFLNKHSIDLALFVPHHGKNSTSLHLSIDTENDLEEQLFSKSLQDGYQSDFSLHDIISGDITFKDFKVRVATRQLEFEYEYRTDKSGYPFLRHLAHEYFVTPYFPDSWRMHSPYTKPPKAIT